MSDEKVPDEILEPPPTTASLIVNPEFAQTGPHLVSAAAAQMRQQIHDAVVGRVADLMRRRLAVEVDISKGQKALDRLNRMLEAINRNEFTVDETLLIKYKDAELNQ